MNSEPELSAEARRLIAAAKGYDDPSREDHERVKTRWLATVAAAASVSTIGEVARAASSSGWAAKAVGWVVALAAGAAGVYALIPEDPSPAPAAVGEQRPSRPALREEEVAPLATPEPVVEVPSAPPAPPEAEAEKVADEAAVAEKVTVVEPAVARPPGPARVVASRRPEPVASLPEPAAQEPSAPAEPAPEATPQVVAAEEPVAPAVPEPSAESSRQLGEETLLLSKIRRSLREGAPGRALEELAEYRARFDKPLLGMEAAALRVDALCRSGKSEAGRAEAELFQATWPSSPLEQRVRAACP